MSVMRNHKRLDKSASGHHDPNKKHQNQGLHCAPEAHALRSSPSSILETPQVTEASPSRREQQHGAVVTRSDQPDVGFP